MILNKPILLVISIILSLLLASCKLDHYAGYYYNKKIETFDPNFKRGSNFGLMYVVDTIYIENPVIVSHKRDYVCSKDLLDSIEINKDFFLRPDVFLFATKREFVYMYQRGGFISNLNEENIEYELLKQTYGLKTECYSYEKIYHDNDDVIVFEIIGSSTFVLSLININFYNECHYGNGNMHCFFFLRKRPRFFYKYHTLKKHDMKTAYYKMVLPYCSIDIQDNQ